MIRFLIVPDMLKNAPMFKPKSGAKGLAAGAGKSAMMRAQGIIIEYILKVTRQDKLYPVYVLYL